MSRSRGPANISLSTLPGCRASSRGTSSFLSTNLTSRKTCLPSSPYVKAVKVRRSFPNTVVIEVTERKPAAKLVSGGLSYVIDEDAYLLDYTALGDEYRLPVINGVAPSTNEPGKQLAFEDPLMLESLKGISDGACKVRLDRKYRRNQS